LRTRSALSAGTKARARKGSCVVTPVGQHAAMAGLGALAQLDLDHLDLRIAGVLLKAPGTETAVG
jgi:hypothetical protein